jgi:short-subunit dehydrogenase
MTPNQASRRNDMSHGWAVVTGASSGIGFEFARELARRGYHVLAVARRRDRLEALAAGASPNDGPIEPLVTDLTSEQGIAMVRQRIDELGDIELLINNAGVAGAGDFITASVDQEIRAIRLNVDAVVALTHHVVNGMVRCGRGAIINLASVVAFQPFPHFAVYAATKAFVLSFTEALAEEVKGKGVHVLALCPGSVATEIDVFAHNEGLLGKLPSLTAAQVVEAGLRALHDGRVVKVVGVFNQFLPFMGRFMPRWAIRKLMGMSVKPSAPESPVKASS